MSSHSRRLCFGVSSDLHGRVWEHKTALTKASAKYKTHPPVYQEFFFHIESAITREKQMKGSSRAKKIALFEKINPGWEDLTPSFDHLGPSTPARQP
jgi:putative endonuclease